MRTFASPRHSVFSMSVDMCNTFNAVVVLSTAAQVCAEADRAGPLAELLEAVNDREDVRGRRHHIQQLVKNLGEQVEQAIPVLRELLVEPEDHKRAGAALALGIIGPGAINSLPDLVVLLDDKAWQVRYAAGTALGLFGPLARSSASRLIVMLADSVDIAAAAAGLALVKIDEDLPVIAASGLVTQMRENEPDVRLSAIVSLGNLGNGLTAYRSQLFGPIHDFAGPQLVVALREGGEAERAAAATALKQAAQKLLPSRRICLASRGSIRHTREKVFLVLNTELGAS